MWTMQQLSMLQYGTFSGLYLMPRHYLLDGTASRYKSLARQEIAQKYNIIMNIGDQWSDLQVSYCGNLIPGCDNPKHYYGLEEPGNTTMLLHIKLPHKYVVA